MSFSRPQSGASFDPSDFATAFNTPTPSRSPLGPVHLAPPINLDDVPAADASPAPSTPIQRDVHTPLPEVVGNALEPPKALGSVSNVSSNRDSYDPYLPSSINNSHLLARQETDGDPEKEEPSSPKKRTSTFRRPLFFFAALVVLIVLVLAIVLPVHFTVGKKHTYNASASSGSGPGSGNGSSPGSAPGPAPVITGGDGSVVTTETGAQFTYKNPFGGFCKYSNRLLWFLGHVWTRH